MSDYTKTTDFAAKDALTSGDPNKAVVGTEIDDEFNAIAVAVNSKYDSSNDNVANGIAKLDASALIFPAQLPAATELAVGALEIATTLETTDLTVDDKIVTPLKLASAVSQLAGNGITETSGVLSISTKLTDIAALAVTDGNIIVGNGTTWVAESGATARASLGVTIGSDVQAYDADLATIAGLTKANGNFIVGNGSAWVAESGNTARTSLGVGTGDSPQFTGIELGHATDTTLTREAAGHMAVQGQTVAQHGTGQINANYSSADIFMSTSAATGGANGDIWFQYDA